MRALIFGGSGQVGSELLRSMAQAGELIAPGVADVPRVDLADSGALAAMIGDVSPDLVINAAAYTAVDRAETDQVAASLINAEAPGVMARAARKISAPIVHYSTDYVFSGAGTAFQTEGDETGPLNHYGASKLEGEKAVARENPQHLILRTSWVYSVHGKNFPKTILRLAQERDSLDIVSDQFGAPTSSALIADATAHAATKAMMSNKAWGLYHLVADGATTWFDYARFLIERAAENDILPKKPKVKPVLAKDFPQQAKRPANSRLSNKKFADGFAFPLPPWQAGVTQLVNQLAARRS